MKVLFIPDLHADEHRIFEGARGTSGYLAEVFAFVAQTVPRIMLKHKVPFVVFGGDQAHEPYRRGKIGVSVVDCWVSAMTELLDRTDESMRHMFSSSTTEEGYPKVFVLPGNHDMYQGGDWLAALEELSPRVTVMREPGWIFHEDYELWGEPWRRDAREIQQSLMSVPEGSIVLGHWAYQGAVYDNGMTIADELAVPVAVAKRFRASILGHIHAPQGPKGELPAGAIVYAGLPFPYSWASAGVKGSCCLIDYDPKRGNVELTRVPTDAPEFRKDVSPDLARTGWNKLPAGSHVRVTVQEGDTETMRVLRAMDVPVNFYPVVKPSAAKTEAVKTRLDVSLDASGDTVWQAMTAYVGWAKEHDTLPAGATADEVLAFGRGLQEGEST